jgi:hypothetical protein
VDVERPCRATADFEKIAGWHWFVREPVIFDRRMAPQHHESQPMTAADFRRIALSLEGVEEYSHAGLPAFRVGGRKFASLASQAEGYGNLMLTLELQATFVEEAAEIFLPIPGGWGKMGHTHIRLSAASEDVLTGALRTAWKLRIDKNAKTSRKKKHLAECGGIRDKKRGKRRL